MRLTARIACAASVALLSTALLSTVTAQEPTGPQQKLQIDQPLTARERSAAVRLTRLRCARLWWVDKNRVTGVSFKDQDANDNSLALASSLPELRSIVVVAAPYSQLTDNGLAPLTTLPKLKLLNICGDRISDAAMTHIGQMRELRTLVVNGNITDDGLARLSTLDELEQLDLTQTRITDAGMVHLHNFPKLHTLVLNGTQITGDSLTTLAELKSLRRLYLGNTPLDDSAVAALQQLNALELLFLLDTQITQQGLEELRATISENCTIIHQSGTRRGSQKAPDIPKAPIAMSKLAPTPTTWRPAK